MGIETRRDPEMPQPEQWLSDHPWVFLLLFALVLGVIVIAAQR